MTDLERDEIEALAQIEDAEADAVIADADADLADLARDAAVELEQDLELVDAIEEASAGSDMVEEGAPVEATEAKDEDPYRVFKEELRKQPGKWYIIHSYAGYEKRVKQNIEIRKQSIEGGDQIFQIEVPMEETVEIKNGQRKLV
ncbi:MAG: hypothetical protein RJA26_1186 [Actinomycetota bacterium]